VYGGLRETPPKHIAVHDSIFLPLLRARRCRASKDKPKPHTHGDHVVAAEAPDIVWKLEANYEDALVKLSCPVAQVMRPMVLVEPPLDVQNIQ
jgi:hypothetical protein